jgi:glycosyltransferase involved in cell wall biosynthesis
MPMALLEAMAQGTPVAATAVGEVPGMLAQGRNGLLVSPGDTGGLTRAILSILQDREAAAARAMNAAEKVRTEYSSEVMGEKYRVLYRSIV